MSSLQTPINSVSLPFLPGFTFKDPMTTHFPKAHYFDYINGFTYPRLSIEPKSISFLPTSEKQITSLDPALIYGQPRKEQKKFEPEPCALDKKILKFHGYFKESVSDSPDELYRVRVVDFFYYLEDDTVMIMEPKIENSGLWQGKFLHRQHVPKNGHGDHLTWKDLNIGITVNVYGREIYLVDCDKWTAEFLKSEGIELNSVEAIPQDPVQEKHYAEQISTKETMPSAMDKLYQYLNYDRKVLRFYCIWDDRNSIFGEIRPYVLLYYLANNTVEIREIHRSNDGHDPFPNFLHRQKLPKERDKLKNDIPRSILEPREDDLDWYKPQDFKIGKMINILGRNFLIYDCDKFTQEYYQANFGITDFTPVKIDFPTKKQTPKLIPPYSGWGSIEDSLQSCYKIQPKPPKKDVIHQLKKHNIVLRYEAELDSVDEMDNGRKFILTYYVSDSTLSIYEPPIVNSGFLSGLFLSRRKVPKPHLDPNKPEYLQAKDFYKGAKVEIFKRTFIITDEDEYVTKYKLEHSEEFKDPNLLITYKDDARKDLQFETKEEADKICCVREDNTVPITQAS